MMEALFGALIGAVLGFFGSFSIWHFEHLRQRRIAKMQIAINVRHWMTRTLYLLQDAETGEDGVGGFFSWQLPDFRFEQSLEQVASVEDQMAVKIFKLIRKKDDANAEVESILEHADEGGRGRPPCYRIRADLILPAGRGSAPQPAKQAPKAARQVPMRRSSRSEAVRRLADRARPSRLIALALTVGAQDGRGRNPFGLTFRKPYDA
jgi:hypothetical protein